VEGVSTRLRASKDAGEDAIWQAARVGFATCVALIAGFAAIDWALRGKEAAWQAVGVRVAATVALVAGLTAVALELRYRSIGRNHRMPTEDVAGVWPWDTVAGTLLSLEEPWRGRFLAWISRSYEDWLWNGQEPGMDDLAGWLKEHPSLCRKAARMLWVWTRDNRLLLARTMTAYYAAHDGLKSQLHPHTNLERNESTE
jgi:hypothetical protein